MTQPESIGIRELRQHASRYVAMARGGQRIPVTVRGELVAYLVPAEQPGSVIAQLEAIGQVRRGVGNLLDLLSPAPAEAGRPTLSETLSKMRDEERY